MNKMLTIAEKKEINEEERSIVGWGSRAVVDRDQEIIQTGGWDLKAFRKNPVLMLSHDYSTLPVGKILWIKDTEEGLKFKAQFATTPTADEVYQLFKEDVMHAFSVGFIPKEWVDAKDTEKPKRTYTKSELLEISCVSIPSCPDALIEAYDDGKVKTKELTKVLDNIEDKSIPGSKTLPLSADVTWDAFGAETRMRNAAGGPDKDKIDWAEYGKGFAWYDKSDAESYRAYKLPFADVKEGKLTAIWRGVATGMAADLGEGLKLTDAERKQVYNFLATYYKRFGKDPPDFKEYTEEELKEVFGEKKSEEEHKNKVDPVIYFGEKYAELKAEMAELKEGRVLSAKNRKLVNNCITQMQAAITELQKLIDATEPEPKKMKEDDIDLSKLDYEEYTKSKEFSKVDIKAEIQAAFKEAAKDLNVDVNKLVENGIKKAQGKIS